MASVITIKKVYTIKGQTMYGIKHAEESQKNDSLSTRATSHQQFDFNLTHATIWSVMDRFTFHQIDAFSIIVYPSLSEKYPKSYTWKYLSKSGCLWHTLFLHVTPARPFSTFLIICVLHDNSSFQISLKKVCKVCMEIVDFFPFTFQITIKYFHILGDTTSFGGLLLLLLLLLLWLSIAA